jgi:hypothetical protein
VYPKLLLSLLSTPKKNKIINTLSTKLKEKKIISKKKNYYKNITPTTTLILSTHKTFLTCNNPLPLSTT